MMIIFSFLLSVSGGSVVSALTRSNCWKLKGLKGWSLWISLGLGAESRASVSGYEGLAPRGKWGSWETLYLLFSCFSNVWEVRSM